MRLIANSFLTTSLVVLTALAAGEARAANIDAKSAVDAVTVYPDGASVTRVVTLDLPAGENSAVLKDLPLTLDPSSLRVEARSMPCRRAPRRRSISRNSTSAFKR